MHHIHAGAWSMLGLTPQLPQWAGTRPYTQQHRRVTARSWPTFFNWGYRWSFHSVIYIVSSTGRLKHRVHTELQWTLSDVHSIMMEKSALPGEGGARPPPFTIFTITYKAVVYAPAERADTVPLFLLYLYLYSVGYKVQASFNISFALSLRFILFRKNLRKSWNVLKIRKQFLYQVSDRVEGIDQWEKRRVYSTVVSFDRFRF